MTRSRCVVCGQGNVAHAKNGLPLLQHRYGSRHNDALCVVLNVPFGSVGSDDEHERQAMAKIAERGPR